MAGLLSRSRRLAAVTSLALVLLARALPSGCVAAADTRPYDEKLLRLAEIMGAVHYLRELCSANDGQIWRQRMQDLIEREGTSALRKATLTRSFNQGYRSYARTYASCTPSAQSAITRFLAEGAGIADDLAKTAR